MPDGECLARTNGSQEKQTYVHARTHAGRCPSFVHIMKFVRHVAKFSLMNAYFSGERIYESAIRPQTEISFQQTSFFALQIHSIKLNESTQIIVRSMFRTNDFKFSFTVKTFMTQILVLAATISFTFYQLRL